METDKILKGYLECMLWSSTDENNNNDMGDCLDEHYDIDDISEESKQKSIDDINNFIELSGDLLNNIDAEQIGRDFWLTRNGHGAGFWDRGLGNTGDELAENANSFGSCDAYVGDDNQIHLS